MRTALWQTGSVAGDPAANVARLAALLPGLAADGVDLLLCPELWTTGYNVFDAVRDGAEAADGPTCRALSALAARHRIALAWGYAEAADGTLYNSARLIGPDGAPLANYRKLHLWGDYERALFRPGPLPAPPVALGDWRVAFSICYDTEFPEVIRLHARRGADLILAPTALGLGVAAIPDLLVPARALENGVFVAFCNRAGTENGLTYHGGSCIAAPDGRKLVSAGPDATMLTATLDRQMLTAARTRWPYLAELRGDLEA